MRESMNMGGSIVSKNILENKGKLKWCLREEPVTPIDNGWRFFSDIDDEEYLSDANNMCICDWGTVVEIEPAVMDIFDMPIGTDISLEIEDGKKYFMEQ